MARRLLVPIAAIDFGRPDAVLDPDSKKSLQTSLELSASDLRKQIAIIREIA
jgi:hypothetical protein